MPTRPLRRIIVVGVHHDEAANQEEKIDTGSGGAREAVAIASFLYGNHQNVGGERTQRLHGEQRLPPVHVVTFARKLPISEVLG